MLTAAEVQALLLSLKVAGTAVLAALPVAIAIAYLLTRRRFPGRFLAEGLVHLPLILPPVVMGYLLLLLLGAQGPLGAWLATQFDVRLVFSWQGATVATAVVTLPFQVRAIRLSLQGLDPNLEALAETLGAGPWDRFFSITLPMILPGVIAGLVTAFSAGLGQFGAIITFVANVPGETRTLPLAIYTALQTPGGEQAAARLAMLAIGLALLGLLASEVLAGRTRRWLSS